MWAGVRQVICIEALPAVPGRRGKIYQSQADNRVGVSLYPRAFKYERAKSLDHAIELLAKNRDDVRPLAGGMSLIPLTKLRLLSPKCIVDIGRLSELKGIKQEKDYLEIGALTTNTQILESAWLGEKFPLLLDTVKEIGDVQVRNRGTVGGNLAQADSSTDWPATMIALRAQLISKGTKGERVHDIDSFYIEPYTTALEPDELLTHVRIPSPSGNSIGASHIKLERRKGDYAIGIVSAQIETDGDGKCSKVGVGIGAVGVVAIRATKTEKLLNGSKVDAGVISKVGDSVRDSLQGLDILSDIKAPADYRLDVIGTLAERCVSKAYNMAVSNGKAAKGA